MRDRGQWDGVLAIARFNWPWYLAAAAVLIGATIWIAVAATAPLLAFLAAVASVWFLAGSLVASHWVYDRSDLYRFHWLDRAIGTATARRLVFCHTGFDECSALLALRFPGARWRLLDHYSQVTYEPSLQRAREESHTSAEPAPHDAWPLGDGEVDVVFAILAVHELRTHEQRVAWFQQARRCLAPGGRVVLVEHVRDLANFLAFGPGFRHFHSERAWQRSWQAKGLSCRDQFRITPFVRVFVLMP
jgi:hypothetical protein